MTIPFYDDWTFWSFVIAGLAVALSQLPPVNTWFRKPKFEVDVYATLFITHKIGNPNAQLQIVITNNSKRTVKIKGMSLRFNKIGTDSSAAFTLPAKSYFQLPGDKNPVLLSSFRVAPGNEWSHVVCFLNFFQRTEDKTFRDLINNMRNELARLQAVEPDRKTLFEVSAAFLKPYLDFYNGHSKWEPGEYSLTLDIFADPATASVSRKFQFALFETDAEQLRLLTDDYKYGAGITWDMQGKADGLFVQIREA